MEKSKRYRLLVLVPVILLLGSLFILFNHYTQTGEWFERSIQLKGGTLITVNTDGPFSAAEIEPVLSGFGDLHIRELSGLSGYGLLISADEEIDPEGIIQALEDYGVGITGSSVETIGPALGESFWAQAQVGIIIAFVLMGVIVLVIFRTLVPSFAVILAAASDIIVTLAIMQVFGVSLSLASLAALLMLIGYSIDTDILLTTRLIRTREEPIEKRVRGAFKTGATMTLTTIGVLVTLLISGVAVVISQIATVLLIGLCIDLINTWLQNAVLLRWHCERRGLG